jgi:membrane protein
MNRKELYSIFKTSFRDWLDDNAVLRAAALTFFIILPLPTLLLIAVSIFSLFFGQSQAIQLVVLQITAVAGPAVAGLFEQLLTSTASPFTSVWTAFVVVGFSIGGAIGAFSVLRDTMDRIWEVKLAKGLPLWKRIRQKIVPFFLLSALGLIVIVWTALANGLFSAIILYSINSTLTAIGLKIAQIILSFAVATLLLAITYKMIPEAKIHWEDVILASIATGIAFTVTNYIFGTYISTFIVTTVAGAAGSLLIILLWIFVLNQIVLFGAEVSKVYAVSVGEHSRQHLPPQVEKILKPILNAGEKIEQATKEDVVKINQPTNESIEQTENEEESKQQIIEQPLVKEEEPKAKTQDVMPKEAQQHADHEEGSVEVSIKIKTPEKKQKSEE